MLFNTAETWSLRDIVLCHLIAAIIGFSMILPATAELWLSISSEVFFTVNGSLNSHNYWAIFWAALNTKAFDILGAVLMFLPSVWYVFAGGKAQLADRLPRASVAWGGVIVAVIISKQLLPEVNFLSPSLVLEPVARLPELVPWMEAKWESKNSFPGDHAVAAFAFVGLSFILMDRKTAWLAALFGLLYSVPRLVSGAHWLSDELVGGGIALFVTLGWVTNIPALNWSRAVWDKILPLFLKEKPAGE